MPYANSSGVRIYYEVVEGDGSPVILHTGAGGDGRMWKEAGYVDGLREFRCILIDHRGHGRSDKPIRPEDHVVDRYVDDVIAVLDTVGVERTSFWGYSSGATVGFALAASQPRRVDTLVTTGAIGPRDYDAPEERRTLEQDSQTYRDQGLAPILKRLEQAEGISFPVWLWRQITATDGEMFVLERLGETCWQGPWSLFKRIRTPVLMLVGQLEDPDGDNQRAAALLPRGRCITLPGLGHIGAFLRADLALSEVVPFLKTHAGKGREPAHRKAHHRSVD